MAANSTIAGFLAPANPVPYDQQLEDQLHATVSGITGIAGTLCRPRYQPDAPTQPDRETNWVAFGINRTVTDNFVTVDHKADTSSTVIRYHEFEVLLSFYGPLAGSYAEIFRDGLMIGQNRDVLTTFNIGVVSIGEARKAPALFKEKWLTRYDMLVTFRRRTERNYNVDSLGSAPITLNTDPVGESPVSINVNQ
jgi:hypothetical protein